MDRRMTQTAAEPAPTDELLDSLRLRPEYKQLEGRLRARTLGGDLIPQVQLLMLKNNGLRLRDAGRRDEFRRELIFQLTKELNRDADATDLGGEERVFLFIMIEDIAGRLVDEYLKEKART